MGTVQVAFEGEQPEVIPLRMLDRKSRDRKGPCSEVCSVHAQPEVAQYPSALVGPFSLVVTVT
jgi:hypothetical protein